MSYLTDRVTADPNTSRASMLNDIRHGRLELAINEINIAIGVEQ